MVLSPLSCRLRLLYPQEQTFPVGSRNDRLDPEATLQRVERLFEIEHNCGIYDGCSLSTRQSCLAQTV